MYFNELEQVLCIDAYIYSRVCVGRMGVFCLNLLVDVWSWQEQGRQCTYNVTLRGARATVVAVEKQ